MPLDIKSILFLINKNLLDSTWNSAQCYVAAWIGGGVWGRIDTCVCMAESLHASPETVTALLIGYTPKQNVQKKKNNNPFFGCYTFSEMETFIQF